jgi:hypothetical protein
VKDKVGFLSLQEHHQKISEKEVRNLDEKYIEREEG